DEDRNVPEYVHQGIYREEDIRHTRFLIEHSVANVQLARGLAQSPAIGGLAIRHPENRNALTQTLARMTEGLGLGPENPLEVWLVSSTAGGTGEGVHRFVAAFLADFMRRNYQDTPLTINFIRVGQLTYRTVNFARTALNTFFGVAADAAFALKSPRDFPALTTHWFYLDVPDVGTGARSIPVRARIVELAAKAVMLKELEEDLHRLLVNNGGIPMVLTRTGYWGRDFGEERKYMETLRQLREKLQRLIEPDYERRYVGEGRRKPERQAGEVLEEWVERVGEKEHVRRRMEDGWRFPPYRLRGYPENLDEVREYLPEWKRAMREMLGEDLDRLSVEWVVERVREEGGETWREMVPLRVSTERVEFGSLEWFQQVEEAHEALAWSRALLGCDLRTGVPRRGGEGNRIEGLLEEARRIWRVQSAVNLFLSSDARAGQMAESLKEFLKLLVEVEPLLLLEKEARRLLDIEVKGVRNVLEIANQELQMIRRGLMMRDYQKYLADYEGVSLRFRSDAIIPWIEKAKDARNIQDRLEQGWKFPRVGRFPHSLAEIRSQVARWKEGVTALLGTNWDKLDMVFLVKVLLTGGKEGQEEERPLRVLARTDNWEKGISEAHIVRAWTWYLLGCDLREGTPHRKNTLVGRLFDRARAISRSLHYPPFPRSSPKKAERVARSMAEFIPLLAQVDYLLRVEEEAWGIIKREVEGKENTIITSELFELPLHSSRKTWLQLLSGASFSGDQRRFRQEALHGVKGLTSTGLCYILGITPRANMDEMLAEIISHIKQFDAPWWAEQHPESTLSYEYRIFPPLEDALRGGLLK
ncbi:MAG: hypothetical protein QW231_05560, partial [Candidatus Bathyarchaeia archaeon]